MENPSNINVAKIFSYYTDNIVPYEVDEQGIQPNLFPVNRTPVLIFTTPSHQFPMGGVLPINRRIRVIYTGTFSKVLFPSIRLGYIVVPLHLVSPIRELKRLADHHSNSIYQLALMRFIENGELARHIRRMKKIYRQRRDFLLESLPDYVGKNTHIYGTSTGMHVVVCFEGNSFTEEHMKRIMQAGVYLVPVSQHSLTPENHVSEIIMGYAGLSKDAILQGLKQIKLTLEQQV